MTQEQIAKAVASYEKQKAYRAAYAKRPEVKEKRREYNKKRWQMFKEVIASVRESN